VSHDPIAFSHAGWWKSRKFWSAVASSAACWGVALASGGVTVPVALACSAPLLGWIGIEGVVDAVNAGRRAGEGK
jgi:hypothetical protein